MFIWLLIILLVPLLVITGFILTEVIIQNKNPHETWMTKIWQKPKVKTYLPLGIIIYYLISCIILANLTKKTGFILLIFILLMIGGFVLYSIFLFKISKKYDLNNWLKNLWNKPSFRSLFASLISIFCGLLIGVLILLCFAGQKVGGLEISWKSAWDGIQLIFAGVFNTGRVDGQLIFGFNGTNIGNMLFQTTPLILTGLSVALAFKTGLFNIGAPGQYLMGTAVTLILALSIPTSSVSPFFVWLIAFLGGILAGALWGAIPGLFKAFLNVNEVITCIMANWIAANIVTSLFDKSIGPFRSLLDPSATKNWAYVFKTSENGVATSKLGLDLIFKGSQINAGIIIAIIFAIVIYIVLNKTTFGYELKACGSNRHAAKYAGINEKRNIVLSLVIAGGLAGAGASLYYLSGNTEFYWSTYQTLPAIGFNGIPVALLASNNPIGTIFAAMFMAYLNVAGMQLKYNTGYNEYITSIIAAIIVYFSAFSLLISQILSGQIKFGQKKKKNKKQEISENVEIIENKEVNE